MSGTDQPPAAPAGGGEEAALALARHGTAEEAFDELVDLAEVALRTGRVREAGRVVAALREVGPAPRGARREAVLAHLEGRLHGARGRHREAEAAYGRAERAARGAGDEHLATTVLMNRGVVATEAGDFARAVPLLARSARDKLAAGDDYGATQAMLNLATAVLERGDVDQAEKLLDAAEPVVRQARDPHLLSTLVGTRARAAVERGDFAGAVRLNREALRHARRSGDAEAVAVSLQNLAGATADGGDAGRALRWYRKALAAAEDAGSTPRVEAVLRGLAVALARAGRLRESADAFERARRLSLELGDRRTWATSTADLGAIRLRLGDLDAADALLWEALAELDRLGDAGWQVRVLENLAEAELRLVGAPVAAELLERALRLAADAERRAELWGRVGDAWAAEGSHERAAAAYRRRLEERSGAAEGHELAWDAASLGRALADAGAPRQAIEFYDRALAVAGGDDQVAFHVGNDRGVALGALGDFEGAQDQFAAGLALARRLEDRAMETTAAMNAGETARRLGDPQRGEELTRRAAVLGRELGDTAAEAQAWHLLGLSLASQGRWGEAEEAHTAAAEAARVAGERETEADATGALANAVLHDGRPEEAVRLYRRALRIGRERRRVQSSEHLAGLVEALSALGRRAGARREAQRLVDVAQRFGEEELAWQALARSARWWLERGQLEEAASLYAAAVVVAGAARRDESRDEDAIFEALTPPLLFLAFNVDEWLPSGREEFYERVVSALGDAYHFPPGPVRSMLAAVRAVVAEEKEGGAGAPSG